MLMAILAYVHFHGLGRFQSLLFAQFTVRGSYAAIRFRLCRLPEETKLSCTSTILYYWPMLRFALQYLDPTIVVKRRNVFFSLVRIFYQECIVLCVIAILLAMLDFATPIGVNNLLWYAYSNKGHTICSESTSPGTLRAKVSVHSLNLGSGYSGFLLVQCCAHLHGKATFSSW